MAHATLQTATGTVINHALRFSGTEYSNAEKQSLQQQYLNDPSYPGIMPSFYTKLDLTQVELLPTKEYNCWGFTFDPRRCVISTGTDVQHILDDNANQVPDGSVQLGDVICYRLNDYITHTGRVWEVVSGHATLVRSKWGRLGEYIHPPLTVPSSYGTDITYWRMHTHIQGRSWLLIRDNNQDTGFQHSPDPIGSSPDIWVDNNLNGNPDSYARAAQVNHIYARVFNQGTVAISNLEVRFYWTNLSGINTPSSWNFIGSQKIPCIAAQSDAVTNPVSWTPYMCNYINCTRYIIALANGGDSITAVNEPDPITYSFNVQWENCIGIKAVAVKNIFKKVEIKEFKEVKEYKEIKEHKEVKEVKEVKEIDEPKQFKEYKELKEFDEPKPRKEIYEVPGEYLEDLIDPLLEEVKMELNRRMERLEKIVSKLEPFIDSKLRPKVGLKDDDDKPK